MLTRSWQGFKNPFGEESCEHELEVLQDQYHQFYYDRGRFNREALHPGTYLIVGRRGAGKTSLAKSFEFQSTLRNARIIDVDEPEVYDDIFKQIILRQAISSELPTAYASFLNGDTGASMDVPMSRIVKLWDYLLWLLVFSAYRYDDPQIDAACRSACPSAADSTPLSAAQTIASSLRTLLTRADSGGAALAELIEGWLASAEVRGARQRVLEIARRTPAIIAIDTMERYAKSDALMMQMTAALIQSASNFNIAYAPRGLHVKIFIAEEIFPHIKESAISNTTKFIRQPIHLHWRPKDLIHLICWRFHRYLDFYREVAGALPTLPSEVDWSDFGDVLNKLWYPFFGREIYNKTSGVREHSFPYILRHTQMRPRQLVVLCNEIARRAKQEALFPCFKELPIADVLAQSLRDLSDEVLNSYARIYPKVAEIVDALRTSPMMFSGSYLDRIAPTTAFAWPSGEYSPANFRRLVAELGIVGRVRQLDAASGIVAADFEYALKDRLPLRSTDTCVIHPMFYTKLQTLVDRPLVVYPFPDHPDFEAIQGRWE